MKSLHLTFFLLLSALILNSCKNEPKTTSAEVTNTPAAEVTGPGLKIGLNGKHILDIIRVIESDKLQLNFISNDKPIIVKDIDDPNFTYVCKPINL